MIALSDDAGAHSCWPNFCTRNSVVHQCFSKTPLALATPYKHLVVMSDPSEDFEIDAVVVEQGGGIGWVVHPMGAADAHPCDWNPAATGQHCDYTSCPRCGAPWYAADGACPCACGAPDAGGISGGHFPELDQRIPYGNSIVNHAKGKSNTIEDRVQVPADISPGEYVLQVGGCDRVLSELAFRCMTWRCLQPLVYLQWRWDCERSDQM